MLKRIRVISFRTCSIFEGVINGSFATISSNKASTSELNQINNKNI